MKVLSNSWTPDTGLGGIALLYFSVQTLEREEGKRAGGSLEGKITFSATKKKNYKLNITQNAPIKIIQ